MTNSEYSKDEEGLTILPCTLPKKVECKLAAKLAPDLTRVSERRATKHLVTRVSFSTNSS